MLYVIHYDRRESKLVDFFRFENNQRGMAYQTRLELEVAHNSFGDREIVLIEADNDEQLKRTHAKYFDGELTTGELVFASLLAAAGIAFFMK